LQVKQVQSKQTQFAHVSAQPAHEHVLWLQVAHVQSSQTQVAHMSPHDPHAHELHSS
jgi:hypothetical protein